jgi:hypothetical protein
MKPKFQWWIWRFRCTLFEAKEISKIMKSPSSMKNGRFHLPKCKGNLQKMEVLYTHSPKMPSPSPNFPHNSKIKKKIIN